MTLPWRVETLKRPAALGIVSVDAVRRHCRIDHTDDDHLLAGFIDAALDHIQQHTRRSWLTRQLRLTVCAPPPGAEPLELRYGPLVIGTAIDVQVRRRDPVTGAVGWSTAMTAADLTEVGDDAIMPMSGYWPALELPWGFRVDYWAGVSADATEVPAGVIVATLHLIAQWYENREAVQTAAGLTAAVELPNQARAMLAPYRKLSL